VKVVVDFPLFDSVEVIGLAFIIPYPSPVGWSYPCSQRGVKFVPGGCIIVPEVEPSIPIFLCG
jgi:hypothetical protein